MLRKLPLIFILPTLYAGCAADTTASQGESLLDKSALDAAKADADFCGWLGLPADCDLCDELGWYGDGICDQDLIDRGFCTGPDPDCGEPEPAFESFALHRSAGPCPPGIDCSGSIELDADGTLRVDIFGELPHGKIHEYTVTDDELDELIAIVTDDELVDILMQDEPPCEGPTDIYESMTLSAGGEQHHNSVTFCGGPALDAARDAMRNLADKYTRVFESFRLGRSHGPCPPDMDCHGFIELRADGTLLVDRFDGEATAVKTE